MKSWRMLVLVGAAGCLCQVRGAAAAEPGLTPVGSYSFLLPGFQTGPDARPKAALWCHGADLLGVVVLDGKTADCGTASQKKSAPRAFLLRDGRCSSDGHAVSFGFLVARQAWVFESPGRMPPQRTAWLLQRFEGSLAGGRLTGVLVQVDVDHPGHAFQTYKVEGDAVSGEQASFADEAAWRSGMAQTLCLAAVGP